MAVCSPHAWCELKRSQGEVPKEAWYGGPECGAGGTASSHGCAHRGGAPEIRQHEVQVPGPSTRERCREAPMRSCPEGVWYGVQDTGTVSAAYVLAIFTVGCDHLVQETPTLTLFPCRCLLTAPEEEDWLAVHTHPWCSQPRVEGTDGGGSRWWCPVSGVWKGHRAWGAGCLTRAHYGG